MLRPLAASLAATALLSCSTTPPPAAAAPRRLAASPVAPTVKTPARPLAGIHLVGRFAKKDAGTLRFAWPASGIVARFRGTSLTVRLTDFGKNQFDVSIDGAPPTVLTTSPTQRAYTVATGLEGGEHDVAIYKRTESFVGMVDFDGFEQPVVPTPEPFERRIEIVGDSISAGYGDLGTERTCGFSPTGEDAMVAYGPLAARALGAGVSVIAYSGIGVIRNGDRTRANTMMQRFDLALADDGTSKWDFSTPAPDVVVVALGTNDFAGGDPGPAFVDGYLALLAKVRGRYPHAYVIVASSPMMSDADPPGQKQRTKLGEYLGEAVAKAHDPKVSFLDFDEQRAADGYGCDDHPNRTTQAKMADKLVAAVKKLTGW